MKNKIFQSRDLCLRALDTNSACTKSVRRNEDKNDHSYFVTYVIFRRIIFCNLELQGKEHPPKGKNALPLWNAASSHMSCADRRAERNAALRHAAFSAFCAGNDPFTSDTAQGRKRRGGCGRSEEGRGSQTGSASFGDDGSVWDRPDPGNLFPAVSAPKAYRGI